MGVKILQRQFAQAVEQILAELKGGLLRHIDHVGVLEVGTDRGHGVKQQADANQPRKARHIAHRDIIVHRDARKARDQNRNQRRHCAEYADEHDAPDVFGDILEQALEGALRVLGLGVLHHAARAGASGAGAGTAFFSFSVFRHQAIASSPHWDATIPR